MPRNKENLLKEFECALTLILFWSQIATNEELKHINETLKEIHIYMFDRRGKKGGKSNADKQE